MRRIKTLLLSILFLCVCGSSVICAITRDTAVCLRLKGTFENAFYKDNRPCTVEVVLDGRTLDVVVLNRFRRKFRYSFDLNRQFTLRVTKEGFVPLNIEVDTRLAETPDVIYHFKFTTRLITEKRARTFNQQALKLPVTVIRYFPDKGDFHYDEEYTDTLKRDLILTPSIQIVQERPYWLQS